MCFQLLPPAKGNDHYHLLQPKCLPSAHVLK
jgi:hypothetical protein